MIVVDFLITKLDGGQFVAGVNFAWKHEIKSKIKVGSVYVDDTENIDSYTKMMEHLCYLALNEVPDDCKYILFQSNLPGMVKGLKLGRKLGIFAFDKTLKFKRKKDLGTISPDLALLGEDAIRRKETIFVDV